MAGRNAGRDARFLEPVSDQEAKHTIHVGKNIRARRIAVGLTQERAAALAGLTRVSIRALEQAEFPHTHFKTLLKLMVVYECHSIEQLLGDLPSDRIASAWETSDWAARAVDDEQP